MNAILPSLLSKALQNKHTTAAGALYALAKWGCPILSIWWPSHKAQIDSTSGYLEGAAVAYGFLTAGDAGKSASKDDLQMMGQATAAAIKTGDTSLLQKTDTTKGTQ